MDLRISSRSLTQILEYWHPTGRRIPVVYADGPDAILLSRQEKLEEDMSEAEFLCRFHPLATEGVRSYGVEVREEGLSFTKPFPPCRAPIRRGKPCFSSLALAGNSPPGRWREDSYFRIRTLWGLPGNIGAESPSFAGRWREPS